MADSAAAWQVWDHGKHGPALNMAYDEALLQTHPTTPVLRFYDWDAPAVTIGYYQSIALAPTHLPTMRRPTGGGHVYHGQDLTYGLILPTAHPLAAVNRFESYRLIHEAIARALQMLGLTTSLAAEDQPEEGVPRTAMSCFRSPAQADVLREDGSKVAGAAQRRTKQGILQQGSIQLVLGSDSRERLIQALMDAFVLAFDARFAEFATPAGLHEAAAKLAAQKYDGQAWRELR
ncbi:MAG TPA: hypothetical protein DCR55_04300 [Lentisphaeria bacterium]|nr:hypothetical protein [Lentisphaeria bacterium]